jgi:hypothetical protein
MSSELVIAVVGIVVALTIGGVQIWQGRWRRGGAPTISTNLSTQTLREEAVAVLMDAALTARQLERSDSRWFRSQGLDKIYTHERELLKLQSRFRIAQGISDEEIEAFEETLPMTSVLNEATISLQERMAARESGSATAEGEGAEWDGLWRSESDFRSALKRFEEVVRKVGQS